MAQALEYKQRLQALDPSVEYLMTLYLTPDITPETIAEAAKVGIVGTLQDVWVHGCPGS